MIAVKTLRTWSDLMAVADQNVALAILAFALHMPSLPATTTEAVPAAQRFDGRIDGIQLPFQF